MEENPIVMYLLGRSEHSDLASCNPGKMAAQVAHAATGIAYNALTSQNSEIRQVYNEWSDQGKGFGTKIVLSATLLDIGEIEVALRQYDNRRVDSFVVVDPSYPFIVENDVVSLIFDLLSPSERKIHSDIQAIKTLNNKQTLMVRRETTAMGILGAKKDIEEMLKDTNFKNLKLHP